MSAPPTDTKSHLRLVPSPGFAPTNATAVTAGRVDLTGFDEPATLDNHALDNHALDNHALDNHGTDAHGADAHGDDRGAHDARRAHPSANQSRRRSGSGERRARDLTQFPPELRRLRRDVLAHGLTRGHAVSPDAVSAILAAKVANQTPLLHFTEDIVWDLLWFDICNWCGLRRLDVPAGVVAAMWVLLEFLHDADLLDAHSDALDDLCAPLQTSGGLDPMGRTRFPV